jgi:hypothetical protein
MRWKVGGVSEAGVGPGVHRGLAKSGHKPGRAARDRLMKFWKKGHDIGEKLIKIDLSTSKKLGKHVVSPKIAGSEVEVAYEINTFLASGESHEAVIRGKEVGVSV